jgi:hypothetical protein
MMESLFNWRRAVFVSGFVLALTATPVTIFATQKTAAQRAGAEKKPAAAAATTTVAGKAGE